MLVRLLMLAPLVPRLLLRFGSKMPGPLPGSSAVEKALSAVSHYGFYGLMVTMPVTGVLMGYYGGKGLPFFFTTLPGAAESRGDIAKQAFGIHKQAGQILEYAFIPVHVGAVGFHLIRGQPILARMGIGAAAAARTA